MSGDVNVYIDRCSPAAGGGSDPGFVELALTDFGSSPGSSITATFDRDLYDYAIVVSNGVEVTPGAAVDASDYVAIGGMVTNLANSALLGSTFYPEFPFTENVAGNVNLTINRPHREVVVITDYNVFVADEAFMVQEGFQNGSYVSGANYAGDSNTYAYSSPPHTANVKIVFTAEHFDDSAGTFTTVPTIDAGVIAIYGHKIGFP